MGFLKTQSYLTISSNLYNRIISNCSSQKRLFNYDHWYKGNYKILALNKIKIIQNKFNTFLVENERQRRVKEKSDNFLKDKTFFDLFKFVAKEGAVEFKKFYNEFKQSDNYK